MNDFGQLQLIWIRRLARETARISTLVELGNLSVVDLVRYKKSISSIDSYCHFVINSQDWDDVGKIPEIIEDVEEKLFVHFYQLIEDFDSDNIHLDFSGEEELSLEFDDDLFDAIKFLIVDEDDVGVFL
ncbi:MAG: hypothetical protein IJP12_03355 [Methanobrevibacter sp.]|nr:hypothetical protein [Methanobrevibacter sp.]